MSPRNGTLLFGLIAWLGGLAIVLFDGLAEQLDWTVGSILMPLGALTAALLAGWIVPRHVMREELARTHLHIFAFWRAMIRYVVPVAIGVIFVMGLAA